MSLADHVPRIRDWVPVPVRGTGFSPVRWVLLEANRRAIVGALSTFTIVAFIVFGRAWTFEVQALLTETNSVQTILNTLLGGIILLVSVVVSINSIVLTHDITAISTQRERIEGTSEFRREIGHVAEGEFAPTNPSAFLTVMLRVIRHRANDLEKASGGLDEEISANVEEFADDVATTIKQLEVQLDDVSGADFGVLWLGLEADFAKHVNDLQAFGVGHRHEMTDEQAEPFHALMEAFELFETGREYFKTLYYTREISELSQTLLAISLPAILVTSWTILAIDAGRVPSISVFGLPPLQVFLAASFTVSLAPYLTLTSYVLRTATVARRTASGGPFLLD
ncbi:hypothetical protein [Halobacterium bonnevillei]|uniref:Uncharacterized protein n=1 Tax=Halobacterium bonnevillei TaxID=2692200 RepID=A0A6B0SMR0_9EURY|nr:hypothetical protein [Halobacterium bonnevillei]MXR20803.1 hypothetical protein [Halobacterium bonnevillei]